MIKRFLVRGFSHQFIPLKFENLKVGLSEHVSLEIMPYFKIFEKS